MKKNRLKVIGSPSGTQVQRDFESVRDRLHGLGFAFDVDACEWAKEFDGRHQLLTASAMLEREFCETGRDPLVKWDGDEVLIFVDDLPLDWRRRL